MSVKFLRKLETPPPQDIGLELAEEAEDHQVFLYGSAVFGLAATGGRSPNAVGADLPVGLQNTITTASGGDGEFQLMLRHLADLNSTPQKSSDLAMLLASGGTLPGEADADVRFAVTVR